MEFDFGKSRKITGAVGWLGLAAYVAAWDIKAPETLSSALARGMERSTPSKLAIVGGMVITCAHLLDLIPEQIDPYDTFFRYAGARGHAARCISERLVAEQLAFELPMAIEPME